MADEAQWTFFDDESGRSRAKRDVQGWIVRATFEYDAIVRLSVTRGPSLDSTASISQSLLRQLGLAELTALNRGRTDAVLPNRLDPTGRVTLGCSAHGPRRARGTHQRMVLALDAWIYSQALKAGVDDPTAELQRQSPGLTIQAARERIRRARAAGLLTPTAKGRAGGELTEAGRVLVAQAWEIFDTAGTLPPEERPGLLPDGRANIVDVLWWWADLGNFDRPDPRERLRDPRWTWGRWTSPLVGRRSHAWPAHLGVPPAGSAACGYEPSADPDLTPEFHLTTRWYCVECYETATGESLFWGVVGGQVVGQPARRRNRS